MKTFLLILVLTSGYLGYQLKDTRQQLASTRDELEKAKAELQQSLPVPTAKKGWLAERIEGRNSSLENGAYDQKSAVARGATIYAPVINPAVVRVGATPLPTPRRN